MTASNTKKNQEIGLKVLARAKDIVLLFLYRLK